MPYEMTITHAHDLSAETIGFGDNKDMAERVFNWTWRGLMAEGYMSLHSAKTPNFIEILQRQAGTILYIELRFRPDFDFANVLRLIHMLALDATFPRYFASGVMQGDVIRSEQAWKEAKHEAHVVGPDGFKLRYALVGERAEALKAFNALVHKHQCGGQIQRCPDADNKWMVINMSGATTLEFVAVQA